MLHANPALKEALNDPGSAVRVAAKGTLRSLAASGWLAKERDICGTIPFLGLLMIILWAMGKMNIVSDRDIFIKERTDELFKLWFQRTALWGALIFILMSFQDRVSSPENFNLFLSYRMVIALVLVALSVLSRKSDSRPIVVHQAIALIAVLASAVTIELMIMRLGGHSSHYYVGHILLAVVVMGFIPTGPRLQLVFATTIYAIYLVPIVVFDTITNMRIFFSANIFLLAILVSTLLHKYFSWRSLLDELGLKFDVSKDFEKLAATEQALRESEGRLSRAQQIAHVGDWEWDIATGVVSWSDELYRIYGYEPGEIPPDYGLVLDRLHPESRDEFMKAIDAALREDRHFEMDYRFFRKDGSEAALHTIGKVIRDAAGAPVRMLGIVQDITERIEVERRIRESEDRFRSIFEQAIDGIMIADIDKNKNIEANMAICDMLGYTRDEIVNLSVADLHPRKELPRVMDVFGQQARGEISLASDIPMLRKDGTIVYVDVNAASVTLGGKQCLIGVFRDITGRKQADAALRAREKQLAESQRIAHIGSWEHNLTTGKVVWSDELFHILGLDPRKDPADFKMFFEMIHPDDRPVLKKSIDETVQTGGHFSVEYRFNLPDGRTRILHAQAELIHDETGTQTILSGTGQDITERKEAEKIALQAEARMNMALAAARQGFFEIDIRTEDLIVSADFARMMGYEPEEFSALYKKWYEVIHPDDRDSVGGIFRTYIAGRCDDCRTAFRQQTRTGQWKWISSIATVSEWAGGIPTRMIGIFTDITERKLAWEAARASEERFRSMFDDSPVSLWEEDFTELQAYFSRLRSSGVRDIRAYFAEHPGEVFRCVGMIRVIEVNRATLMIYEARDRAALLDDLSSVFTPESLNSFREIMIAIYEGVREFECETVNQTLMGRKINVLLRWALLSEGSEKSRALISVVDISARKLAEEKLRQSEEFIRSILDTVDEGFIVIDSDYRILTANRAYSSQVGEPNDRVIGRHCYEISHRTQRPCYEMGEECAVRHVFASGEPHEALHKHPDGRGGILYVETRAFPIKDSEGVVISVIETVNNITEKFLLEEERLKTQKLEAIGTLAGGIAHDFNNLLQGVFGYISLAKMVHDEKERSVSMLDQAEKALHMSVNLTSQLLTFSKGGKPVKKKLDLLPVIENSVRFALSGSNVEYRIRPADDLMMVDADEGQVGQVIQNIVLNADQAMPMGGTLVITARNVHVPARDVPQSLGRGDYVEIAVKDSGIGIPDKYLKRIFDPYFTTKEKGSGLGLATSYSIIRNHGGLINVKSELGKGTTFFVYLPAIEAVKETSKIPAATPVSRRAKILFMDDEEVVRAIAGELIKALGHDVDFAEHGEAAIEKYRAARESGTPFDLVILDLTIRGGMGGAETLGRLLSIDPGLKAVVSSGYADSAVVSDYRKHGFCSCLTKPYRLDELRNMLHELLGE